MIFKCQQCGKEFNMSPSRRKQNTIFCCKKCFYENKRQKQINLQKITKYNNHIEVCLKSNEKIIKIKLSLDNEYIPKTYSLGLDFDKTINNYYVYIRHNRDKRERLHRFITKCPSDMQVDHINRNTLDNRRENLRICTPKINVQNRGLSKNNSSGYVGVSYRKKSQKWIACIERIFLGEFLTKEEAINARKTAQNKLWKELQ